jgi:hypothetical protein
MLMQSELDHTAPGTFLVRERPNKAGEYVISVALSGNKAEHHTLSRDAQNNFRMNNAALRLQVCVAQFYLVPFFPRILLIRWASRLLIYLH